MPRFVCRCCGAEIPPEYPRVEVVVGLYKPRPGNHAVGRTAAAACTDCADAVADGVLYVAQLWTPTIACQHQTVGLF